MVDRYYEETSEDERSETEQNEAPWENHPQYIDPKNLPEEATVGTEGNGVRVGNHFYEFKNIPVSELIEMMGNPLVKDLPIDWSKTKYGEQPVFADSRLSPKLHLRLSQLSDYTGIFGTDDPFLIELDIPWDQTQWPGMQERFDSGQDIDLRLSEIDEDPPVVLPGTDIPRQFPSEPSQPGETNTVTAGAIYGILRSVGFTQSQATTMVAIARAESGFNSNATNMVGPDNSYGLFQINMIGNLGPAREAIYSSEEFKEKYGLSGEWQGYETLLDPRWNIAAAHHTFEEARRMTNAGNYDTPFDPWSVYTNGAYEQFLPMGEEARRTSVVDGDGSDPGYVGDGGAPGIGGGGVGGMPEFDDEVYAFLNEQFGAGMYFFMQNRDGMRIGLLADGTPTDWNDPDAVDLVDMATYIAENEIVSEPRILSLFSQTQWWQTTDNAMREFDIAWEGMSDPQKQEYLEPTIDLLEDRARYLGVDMNREEVFELAKTIKRFGDSENAEAINVAVYAYAQNLEFANDLSAFEQDKDEVKKLANSYYVPITDGAAQDWASQLFVEAGNEGGYERVLDEYEQFLKQAAVSRFPTLDRAINELGVTPETFFSPYKYQIEQMLERPNIDMVGEFADVIEYIPEGGMEARPMTLGEVRKFVRALPEWQQTGNAKDQARALSFAIGKTFGEVA
jgi:hypothetical protein